MAEITDNLPCVSIVVLMDENTELMPIFLNNYNSLDYRFNKCIYQSLNHAYIDNYITYDFENKFGRPLLKEETIQGRTYVPNFIVFPDTPVIFLQAAETIM